MQLGKRLGSLRRKFTDQGYETFTISQWKSE